MKLSFSGSLVNLLMLITCLTAALPTNAQKDSTAYTVDDWLNLKTVSADDLSYDGKWLVLTSNVFRDRLGNNNFRLGDPTYVFQPLVDVSVMNTQTGEVFMVSKSKVRMRSSKWSPDGSKLAMFIVEDELLVAMIWNRLTEKLERVKLPEKVIAANNSQLEWMPDGSEILLSVRPLSWRQKVAEQFRNETEGPIVVYSSKESFLSWDSLRRMSLSRSIIAYNIKSGKTREIVPETKIAWHTLSEDGSFLILAKDSTSKTDYDAIGGSESQIQYISINGGDKRTILKSTKELTLQWSRDYRHYAYAKDGSVFVGSVLDNEPKQITGKKAGVTDKNSADSLKRDTTKYSVIRLSPKGDKIVVSSKEGLWLMQSATGEKELIVKMPEEDKEAPKYLVYDWSPTGDSVYLSYAARTKWDRGISRYDNGSKKLEVLRRDSLLYNNFKISRDGSKILYGASTSNRPPSIYLSDLSFKNTQLLYDASLQLKDKQLSKTQLVSYLDADGNKMFGVLYYPADYVQGKKYPTVFNVYEDFFDDNFGGTINILTNNGYAVMQPSVTFETGFPGEAWLKGVTAAANKLIELGIADPDRLGVQGTSYGGYATNLLITQTNRFKAAVNISGKVNMISFYTGSPRLGVRNINAAEKTQDRIGASLWQQPQKYIQHSAVMFADRIKTPLLLISGGQDHNVPAEQSREMFYALRRLGKEVQWVNYINAGHGMPTTTVEEMKDYHKRILDWYNIHLKADLKKKAEDGQSVSSIH